MGKLEGEKVLEDCGGPVADSQVRKQQRQGCYFLKKNLVLSYCLMLTLSRSAPANHCHHPSLTGGMKMGKLPLKVRGITGQWEEVGEESQCLQSRIRCFISLEVQHSFSWRNNTSSLSWNGTISPWCNSTDVLSMQRKWLSVKEQCNS